MTVTPQDIDSYLSQIEYEYDIRIIGAWNKGSQAWGLSNKHSDWDIGCIFTQPLTNYALITNYKQTVDIDGSDLSNPPSNSSIDPIDIDFIGWDIKRFLELVGSHDPTALELLHSPIGYRVHEMLTYTKEYTANHFNFIEMIGHYQSFTKNIYKQFIFDGDKETIKKNILCARGLLNGMYIHDQHEFPPLDFPTMVETVPDDSLLNMDRDYLFELVDECQHGDKQRKIGNPFKESIETFINMEIDYKNHLREPHETDEYHCDASRCNGYISSHEIDAFMEKLLRSKTLFR